ncbi:GNAT family N-acetyltransferase [Nocardioides ganghwensis]|uniref:GCN5 family acetyltransferase n=1 Tax=Nocardioides ganghwensis TaxID=252230 RepID=A0A4Q2S783_9ACTN|nr:GCN5 family acetyltransferase [Nocardioides ganghwensis]MBD3947687.1 GCN5 family acetyltransferase [Nocardioides ganghwensis]RYB98332.1 GCN5 family acetyltransferase [Nocardioides ganghwensis]
MTPERLDVEQALPRMQALASRTWSPESRHHPGQLAWSAAYGEPDVLDLGPAYVLDDAWAWLESLDWLEVCGTDPAAVDAVVTAALAGAADEVTASTLETEAVVTGVLADHGFVEVESPWFTHHHLDLADLPAVGLPEGYAVRAVRPGEHEQRAAVHRAAWSPTSRVTTAAYERLMTIAPYRPALDHVVTTADGEWVASCCVWLDPTTGVALVEPVGCVAEHGGRGLATAASVSALTAARDAGATTGLVCPRGDDDHPGPARLYRRIGFVPGARTRTYRWRRGD